jgi:glutamine amidotransferase
MKKAEIAVIDYGMGNLRSVAKALELVGAKAIVSDDPKRILAAQAVVFPGVGSFGPAMDNLKEKGLDETIKDAIFRGRSFLGLCLGFQLLLDLSYEEGKHEGLGILRGEVPKFKVPVKKSASLRIPHMGWNTVRATDAGENMFKGIPDNAYFYFVHSYYCAPMDMGVIAGKTSYGIDFCSAIVKNGIWACQFHPEKSGKNGIRLLRNFVQEVEKCS